VAWNGAWPSLRLVNLRSALLDLAILVRNPPNGQADGVTSALSRFLVVRTCGYLEQTIDDCCRAYLASTSSPKAAAFGSSWLGHGASPNPGKLEEVVGRFDVAWKDELHDFLTEDDEFLKRELSFLVDRRIKIAHGLNENLGAVKALGLLDSTLVIADWFIETLDPS